MSLQVVKYGTKVKTIIGNISAIITGVMITENNCVEYRLSYFNNGEHTIFWVYRSEFEIDHNEKPQKAGLVNYDSPEDDENKTQILLQ